MPKLVLTLLIGVLSYCTVSAQDNDLQPVKDVAGLRSKIKTTASNTHTIDCDFKQLKHLSFMASDIQSSGHFSFKKEKKIRWEYQQPFEYMVIINGDNIYLQDEKKTSHFDAQSNKMFQGINDMMMAIVQGDVFDTGDFDAAFFESEQLYFVELQPVNSQMKSYLDKIEMYFDKKDMTLSKLKLVELSGDYTYIEYSNKQINIPLDDSLFTIH